MVYNSYNTNNHERTTYVQQVLNFIDTKDVYRTADQRAGGKHLKIIDSSITLFSDILKGIGLAGKIETKSVK